MEKIRQTPCSWLTLFLFALFLILVIASIPKGEGPRYPTMVEGYQVPSEVEILRAFEGAAASSPFLGVVSTAFTLVVALGIVIDLRFAWHWIKKKRGWSRLWAEASWELGDVAKVIVVFLMAFFSLDSLYPLFVRFFEGLSDVSFVVSIQFLAELAAVWFLIKCVSSRWRSALGELGLARGNLLRHIATGVTAYIGFLPVLVLLSWLTEEVARHIGIGLEAQEQIGFFFADLSTPSLAFLVIFVALVGPVFEEMFFRGFAYQALRSRWGRWPSILATALLFSLLHASAAAFLPILGLGVLLACVFEASGSLIPSIVIHVCQNSVAVAGALLVRSLST